MMEVDPIDDLRCQQKVHMLECNSGGTQFKGRWKQMADEEKKKAAIQEELRRMHLLPANSAYATHRLRVLNKILQLMSIQRSATQDEELESLFARLSL
ncbi:hypothetical protein Dimus_019020 [Dionaea muscipula]